MNARAMNTRLPTTVMDEKHKEIKEIVLDPSLPAPRPHHQAWCAAGLFMILLILSLPFYSAQVLAVSVQVTKNTGQANIPEYIDAKSDTWTVEATITGAVETTTDPSNVKIKVGQHESKFNSCTESPLGILCQYLSPLTSGVRPDEYKFQVYHNYTDELGVVRSTTPAGGIVRADAAAPVISNIQVQQLVGEAAGGARERRGQIQFDFTVTDLKAGQPAVGLKKIEVEDANTGSALWTYSGFQGRDTDFSFSADSKLSPEKVTELFSNSFKSGQKSVRLVAEDRLGHRSTAVSTLFSVDFIAPDIVPGSLNFTQVGSFVGQAVVRSPLSVKVMESGDLTRGKVLAYSEQASLDGAEASCESMDEEKENLWRCTWGSVEVLPESTVSVRVVAEDGFGNRQEKTLPQSFNPDTTTPSVVFFGTERSFFGKHYVKSGKNRVVLRATDVGSWFTNEGITADIGGLTGGTDTHARPTSCNQTESAYICYWDTQRVFSSEGETSIGLSTFKDRVGNEGELPRIAVTIDMHAPMVEKLQVFGVSAAGDKDYFQSGDQLKLVLTVVELSGVAIAVDLKGVVMDAVQIYPENEELKSFGLGAGWLVVGSDTPACTRKSGESEKDKNKWICEFKTDPIKSGPANYVPLKLKVFDTAGNEASDVGGGWPEQAKNVIGSNGQYSFDIFGLTVEERPDYWEDKSVTQGLPGGNAKPFVDLDTVNLIPSRTPITIALKSNNSQAQVIAVELPAGSCALKEGSTGPELSRAVLYGGVSAEGMTSPRPKVVLEFAPFDGRALFNIAESEVEKWEGATAEYTCRLRIYSKLGANAVVAPEVEEVTIPVVFGFSELGAVDENLAKQIIDIKESAFFIIANKIHYLNTILQIVKVIGDIVNIIASVYQLISLFDEGITATATALEDTGFLSGAGAALRGQCTTLEYAQLPGYKYVEGVQAVLQIFNCNPNPRGEKGSGTAQVSAEGREILGWYGRYQESVLKTYNLASGRALLGVPAASLYENMYASILGLCIPGMVFNVEKAREIQCRKIVCLGREVPAGIATVEACNQLHDLQMCEYVWGPGFDFVALGGVAQVGRIVQSALSSPLGLIKVADVIACGLVCWKSHSPGFLLGCKITTFFNRVAAVANSIVDAWQTRPTVTSSPYCDLAEDIDIDELTMVSAT